MKRIILAAALVATGSLSLAHASSFTDSARVVDVRPVYEHVVSRNCAPSHIGGGFQGEHVVGTVVGGLVGGVLGNQIGRGRGNTLSTVVGAFSGAAAGSYLAGGPREVERDCTRVVDNAIVGYDTTYEYRGVRDTVRTSYDPGVGSVIQVSVSVSPAR
ncbi:glycine zipper 2TM domain-containing protein [Burkholderia cenocepacia]|uniref:glycine zipper 2TM domain-containing protein n=1 Tax=Burkholderia cenocepacia TaxID=95486 RepID=UPI001365ADE1|nr:glycine zipper 2TM domain-containing protein [Burkholderia cenocepacia]